MPRSKWKGLFCDGRITKAVQKALDAGGAQTQNLPIRVWSRGSAILPEFVGYRFEVHNGIAYLGVDVTPGMVGHKFGEFALTRKYPFHPEVSAKCLLPLKSSEGDFTDRLKSPGIRSGPENHYIYVYTGIDV